MTQFNRSTVESPVVRAWRELNTMTNRRKGIAPSRKEAIARLTALGVSPGTAAVQFHKWLREATQA